MGNILVELHAIIGILSAFAFLLVFVELLNPTEKMIRRIKLFALSGTALIFISWIIGGYYYVTYYGPLVKPAIKGSIPWVHSVIMETKEHIFLFLPLLAILVTGMIFTLDIDLLNNHKAKSSVLMLCVLIILIGLAIAGMGYLVSAGAFASGGLIE